MALAVTSAPFQQVAMPALDLRRYVSALGIGEGITVATDMAVAQRAAGANMSVDIAAGNALILGDAITNQGVYLAYNDATFNLTGFTAAHATLPRIDRIAVRVRDAFHGDAANDVAFVILTGTATAGATLANLNGVLAVPGSHLLLANVLIPATATTVTTANIDTTVRPRLSVASGSTPVFDTTVVGSVASSIDTGPILPTTFANMLIVVYARGDTAATAANVLMRFNNDGGANYQSQSMTTTNATVTAAELLAASSLYCGAMPANTATANYFSAHRISIPHYANTANHKATEATGGFRSVSTTGGGNTFQTAGWWSNTAAINRVTIFPSAGNFAIGTRMTVYVMGA